jgi:hypothetical protein
MTFYNARTRTPPQGTYNLPPAARQGVSKGVTGIIAIQQGCHGGSTGSYTLCRGGRGGCRFPDPPTDPPRTRALQGATEILEHEVKNE